MADPADLGAGGTQEYPNYADDEGETLSLRCYALDGPSSIHSLSISFAAFGTREGPGPTALPAFELLHDFLAC